jgi:hypothetical protein
MTVNKTLVIDLKDKEKVSELVSIEDDINVVHDYLMDGSISVEDRIILLDSYYVKYEENQTIEIVSRISTMYQFSGTRMLERYLYDICVKSKLSSFLKIIAAKSMCYFDSEKEIGYKAMDTICQDMRNVATPCQIEAVCLLMLHKTYRIRSLDYFCNIINNQELDCDYRYKTILSLENKDIKDRSFFIEKSIIEFLHNEQNRTLYRILAGQYIIQNCKVEKEELYNTELILMSFAEDPDMDYDLRADSADVILRIGSSDNKVLAREIIMMLGRYDGKVKTIFDNAQNVHINEIEDSVLTGLEFLSGIEMKTMSGVPGTPKITFEYVKKYVLKELEKSIPIIPEDYEKYTKKLKKKNSILVYDENKKLYDEKEDKINISLNRIYLDRALYSNYNCCLSHILLKIWTYIVSNKSVDDMKIRLLEELVDMSGTCSSGFASRLVNVISGYGDFNLNISWRDQIIANFTGRLNARARDIVDITKIESNSKLYEITKEKDEKTFIVMLEDFQEKVISEMMISTNDFESRKNFLKFFRKNMLSIREELYKEFDEHIPPNDFDLYFRSAISNYETGGYV